MSNMGAALTKQVGPMPLGAWLLVGGGGLFIAYKSRQGEDAPAAVADPGDALPTGGGYGKQDNAFGSYDGAPVVLSPIIQLPNVTIINRLPSPPVPVPVVVVPPPAPPRVPPGPAPKPTTKPLPKAPAPKKPAPKKPAPKPARTYTVKSGDTLWAIAGKHAGANLAWPLIYTLNRAIIEKAAKAHGKGGSGGGHWIYPGTVLRLP